MSSRVIRVVAGVRISFLFKAAGVENGMTIPQKIKNRTPMSEIPLSPPTQDTGAWVPETTGLYFLTVPEVEVQDPDAGTAGSCSGLTSRPAGAAFSLSLLVAGSETGRASCSGSFLMRALIP